VKRRNRTLETTWISWGLPGAGLGLPLLAVSAPTDTAAAYRLRAEAGSGFYGDESISTTLKDRRDPLSPPDRIVDALYTSRLDEEAKDVTARS
jgi:hypothetical protein